MRSLRWSFAALILTACTFTAGGRPRDMSAAQHDAAAAREDRNAADERYELAALGGQRCQKQDVEDRGPCWTSLIEPTREQLDAAHRHRVAAAAHRAASRALRQAEADACEGTAPYDRDMSPFAHAEDVIDATEIVDRDMRLRGAIVTFRKVPGLRAEWLDRTVHCHMARNAVLGFPQDEMPYCPLMLPNTVAKVAESEAGIAVSITSEDPASAKEILVRARALVAR